MATETPSDESFDERFHRMLAEMKEDLLRQVDARSEVMLAMFHAEMRGQREPSVVSGTDDGQSDGGETSGGGSSSSGDEQQQQQEEDQDFDDAVSIKSEMSDNECFCPLSDVDVFATLVKEEPADQDTNMIPVEETAANGQEEEGGGGDHVNAEATETTEANSSDTSEADEVVRPVTRSMTGKVTPKAPTSESSKPRKAATARAPGTGRRSKQQPPTRMSLRSSGAFIKYRRLPIQCHYNNCNSSHISREAYYKHLVKSHNLTPYICQASGCGAGFTTKFKLGGHVRTKHPNETVWTCGKCHKSFTTSSNLSGHIKLVHALAPYQCAIGSCRYKNALLNGIYKHQLCKHHH